MGRNDSIGQFGLASSEMARAASLAREITPEKIALQAVKFDQALSGVIVPFLGINAFLIAGIMLSDEHPERVHLIAGFNVGAGILFLAWSYFRRRQHQAMPVLLTSGAFACLLAGISETAGPFVSVASAVILTYALAAMAFSGMVAQSAMVLFLVYLPVVLFNFVPAYTLRVSAELLAFVPLAIFMRQKFRVAAGAVVVAGLFTACIEASTGNVTVLLGLLLVGFVVLAILNEIRVVREEHSDLRFAVDQAVILMLLVLFLKTFLTDLSLIWVWAAVSCFYQAVQCWREELKYPTRIGVAAVAITVALWVSLLPKDDDWPDGLSILGSLAFALLVTWAAQRLKNAFLSNLAFLLIIPGAIRIGLEAAFELSSISGLLFALLTTGVGLFIASRPRLPNPIPLWQGFIKTEHAEWIKGVFRGLYQVLQKIPFVGLSLNIVVGTFVWIKYFKGNSETFSLNDLYLAASHAFGAYVVSQQAAFAFSKPDSGSPAIISLLVWATWGLLVFFSGARHRSIYQRFLGVALVLAPWGLNWRMITANLVTLLIDVMITGCVFVLIGIVNALYAYRGAPDDATTQTSESSTQGAPASSAA
jgi:hypothetical protein